jgi:hypothetical protein
MRLRVFTLRWDEATGAFDDRAMTEFLDREDQPRSRGAPPSELQVGGPASSGRGKFLGKKK